MQAQNLTPEQLKAAAERLREWAEQNEHASPAARDAFECARAVQSYAPIEYSTEDYFAAGSVGIANAQPTFAGKLDTAQVVSAHVSAADVERVLDAPGAVSAPNATVSVGTADTEPPPAKPKRGRKAGE